MCEFLDSIEAKGFKKGKKAGQKSERSEIKLVAAYLKLLGKLEELPEIIENRRRFSYYLGKARKAAV